MTAATLMLTDFLLARIAEDEETAREELSMPKRGGVLDWSWRDVMNRMLAECASKRAIVERANVVDRYGTDDEAGAIWFVLEALATVYADHPDYDKSWRP